jgi:hypothetical protein
VPLGHHDRIAFVAQRAVEFQKRQRQHVLLVERRSRRIRDVDLLAHEVFAIATPDHFRDAKQRSLASL